MPTVELSDEELRMVISALRRRAATADVLVADGPVDVERPRLTDFPAAYRKLARRLLAAERTLRT